MPEVYDASAPQDIARQQRRQAGRDRPAHAQEAGASAPLDLPLNLTLILKRPGIPIFWFKRLAKWQVDMHDAALARRRGIGARRQRAQIAHGDTLRIRFRQWRIDKPICVSAIELDLVNRLVGAAAAQLMGAIGGERDKRDA